jgi:hypothetical protein
MRDFQYKNNLISFLFGKALIPRLTAKSKILWQATCKASGQVLRDSSF